MQLHCRDGAIAIVDPGPADESHLRALLAAVRSERVETILVTHTHGDHSMAANALRGATGARVVGAAPYAPRRDGQRALIHRMTATTRLTPCFWDGERLQGGDFAVEVVATPGHCANHLCFAMAEERALFSGDHVMAWSTSVVTPPDGSMSAYMASHDRFGVRAETIFWPGHGGSVLEPQGHLRALIRHRRQREAAILAALREGEAAIPDLVAKVYVDLAPPLIHAAGLSTLSHLKDLSERGLVVRIAPAGSRDTRFRLA